MIENFSKKEEKTNAILHGIGFSVAVAALVLLVVYHHALWHMLVLFASLCHFFTMLFLVAE